MAQLLPIAVVSGHFDCLEMAHGSGVPELAGALEAILKLGATRFHRAGADWKALRRHWIAIEFPLEFRPRIAIKDSHQG